MQKKPKQQWIYLGTDRGAILARNLPPTARLYAGDGPGWYAQLGKPAPEQVGPLRFVGVLQNVFRAEAVDPILEALRPLATRFTDGAARQLHRMLLRGLGVSGAIQGKAKCSGCHHEAVVQLHTEGELVVRCPNCVPGYLMLIGSTVRPAQAVAHGEPSSV